MNFAGEYETVADVSRGHRLKSLLGRAVYGTGLYRAWFRNKAVIVLFHRVDDRCRGNPISCSAREFKDYCRFFRRYFKVVGLGELLDRLEAGLDISRHLVITFDDGYRDNHAVAAPILRELGLPACFFVATNFVASNHVPWWDNHLGFEPEWMSWDEVRSLHQNGFEVGAHTMNHVDLGVVQGPEAVAEITGSRDRLAEEIGISTPFFSYPYGRRNQLSEENREAVRQARFRCCVSAYGGAVSPSADPFRLQRVPISPWYGSAYQFGLEVMFETP